MLSQINYRPTKIADQCKPGHAFQVPEERNLFHPHCRHACSRSDNQRTAACAGGISKELPEKWSTGY